MKKNKCTSSGKQDNDFLYDLIHCKTCNKMTNHKNNECMKCYRTNEEIINSFWEQAEAYSLNRHIRFKSPYMNQFIEPSLIRIINMLSEKYAKKIDELQERINVLVDNLNLLEANKDAYKEEVKNLRKQLRNNDKGGRK